MSIEVMTMVFRRYPAGGNERLLALALADQASADGTSIYPSVAKLAGMSAQSERSVQRLLHVMLASGWLQLVRKSTGRRGDCNEYRISPEWIAGGASVPPPLVPDRRTVGKVTGANLAPVNAPEAADSPVDNLSTTGDTQGLSGDTQGLSGDTAVSPNPVLPVITHSPQPPVDTGGGEQNPKTPDSGCRGARPSMRWRDSFEGIKKRGQQLGLTYSRKALGTAWTDAQLLAHDRAYRHAVERAHAGTRRGRREGAAA